MAYCVIEDGFNCDVIDIHMTEHDIPYIQITYNRVHDCEEEEVELLVDNNDVARCGENIISFYCLDDDDLRFLIGESTEMMNVMRMVDIIYKKEWEREA